MDREQERLEKLVDLLGEEMEKVEERFKKWRADIHFGVFYICTSCYALSRPGEHALHSEDCPFAALAAYREHKGEKDAK